ncbi:NADP-dependent oxidoreductase [Antiquaquibacter soli]|uniref:NADP-dependent oxidoreductase n=1 Tax=Antiquaquibacter soli TaxID=3064523 RepID=A0ABT9BPM8_9MICO|nr:NADP-dependent oxidoreductase [Protaetiibacter sp. WY-16]MDO7882950.1 NADP-dependent oxidoreductase [Protaetiibacter sp. WY-16]
MSETMTAVVQDSVGGPELLHLGTVPRPTPGIGEVLVRVHAAGVNPADHMNRQRGVFSGQPPFVLGWDVSGEIAAVGPGVTVHRPGDEVFGLLPFPRGAGAYAEFVVAPARALVPKPAVLDHVRAAALPLAGLTAWQALVDTAHVGPGDRVVITGAAGGVGHLAVQIAAHLGAEVTAVTSAATIDHVLALGAHRAVDYRSADFATQISDADVVLEVVGEENSLRALRVLRPGGILVVTLPQSLPALAPVAAELGVRVAGLFVEADRLGMTALADLAAARALRPTISATYPLADAAQAHTGPHAPGKVVLTVA